MSLIAKEVIAGLVGNDLFMQTAELRDSAVPVMLVCFCLCSSVVFFM